MRELPKEKRLNVTAMLQQGRSTHEVSKLLGSLNLLALGFIESMFLMWGL